MQTKLIISTVHAPIAAAHPVQTKKPLERPTQKMSQFPARQTHGGLHTGRSEGRRQPLPTLKLVVRGLKASGAQRAIRARLSTVPQSVSRHTTLKTNLSAGTLPLGMVQRRAQRTRLDDDSCTGTIGRQMTHATAAKAFGRQEKRLV